MKKDKEVKELIEQLNLKSSGFLEWVAELGNQCAFTDRFVEEIISTAQKLEKVYNNR